MGLSEEKLKEKKGKIRTRITDHSRDNEITFWPCFLGLSHHNASPGDGNKWVIVPCWSYGGPIYITSKSMLDYVGKHCIWFLLNSLVLYLMFTQSAYVVFLCPMQICKNLFPELSICYFWKALRFTRHCFSTVEFFRCLWPFVHPLIPS